MFAIEDSNILANMKFLDSGRRFPSLVQQSGMLLLEAFLEDSFECAKQEWDFFKENDYNFPFLAIIYELSSKETEDLVSFFAIPKQWSFSSSEYVEIFLAIVFGKFSVETKMVRDDDYLWNFEISVIPLLVKFSCGDRDNFMSLIREYSEMPRYEVDFTFDSDKTHDFNKALKINGKNNKTKKLFVEKYFCSLFTDVMPKDSNFVPFSLLFNTIKDYKFDLISNYKYEDKQNLDSLVAKTLAVYNENNL